jgi:hypothetical protein
MARKYPTTPMCDGELLERFEPTARPTDVFVVTSAKCGQTWLQALLFHLKTGGREPDFGGKGLGGVSPWLEIPAGFLGSRSFSTHEERLAQFEALDDPRVFKMHVVWEEIPRPSGCEARVVTVTRDPRDVPYSMFCHLHALEHGEGKGPPDDFGDYFDQWMEFGFYFKFLASFWPHREDPDVLWLRYEDMQRDLRGETRRLVEFLGWDAGERELERALPLVDFERMRSRERSDIFRGTNAPWKEGGRFFREGAVGKNRARLSEEQERRILDRLRAELPAACCDFVLSLER